MLAGGFTMNSTTKTGLGILAISIVLGLLGDALLRATPWGINVFLWTATLVAAVILLARALRLEVTGAGRWLALPGLFFAAAVAWRASPVLVGLNVLALLVSLALAASCTRSGRLVVSAVSEYGTALVSAGLHAILGPLILLARDIEWKTIPRQGWSGQALAVGRGLLLALPLLCIFGALFMAADAVFEGIVVDLFGWDIDEILSHLFLAGFWGWLVAGLLQPMLLATIPTRMAIKRPAAISLGMIETGVILGLLNLLFFAFVVVQFGYFFGGAARVEASIELTYAEYARRGFFELVTVAALVLPVLLFGDWLLRKENPAHERLFRWLAGALVVMLFIIMASALQRMRLYQQAFGLTELRLYTTAFMGWLAVVFAWFMLTMLRGSGKRFAFGALVSGFAVIALLHLLNPDGFIVQTNAGRVNAEVPFDSRYVTSLSADAVPALLEALPGMEREDACVIATRLLAEWSPPEESDWRTWNWSRSRAREVVAANANALKILACP
jgi:hypothetical protein